MISRTYQLRFQWEPLTLCQRLWWRLFAPLVAWLLHVANTSPPFDRSRFYDLKRRLLEQHGLLESVEDIQHIVHECWGYYSHWDEDSIPCGPDCRKCGGTGIFRQRWFALRRYVWRGYKFHVPNHEIYSRPELPITITGRIQHRKYEYRFTQECCLWLYLICGEWSLLWKTLRGSRACGWTWYPLLNLQKVVMELSMRLSRHRCFCGKRFWTWGTGGQICPACRARNKSARCAVTDDTPF